MKMVLIYQKVVAEVVAMQREGDGKEVDAEKTMERRRTLYIEIGAYM